MITGLAADAERLALARKMGFKTVCASDRDWTDQVRALMPPDGADVVFDAAGFLDSAVQLVRRGGQLVELGWPARDMPNTEMRALFFHGVKIMPSRVRVPDTWRRSIALVASGAVDLRADGDASLRPRARDRGLRTAAPQTGVKALIMPQGT